MKRLFLFLLGVMLFVGLNANLLNIVIPISTNYEWMGESNQDTAYYGISVASAGDVNGDGYSDVVVGATYYDDGETDEGAAFLYYGSESGPSLTADWMHEGNQDYAYYGGVSSAGDVNGDGYSDLIVTAYKYNNPEPDEGVVYVYYGSASGISDTPDWIGENNQSYSDYGVSAASAGDVNGDGYGDIIIGAYLYDDTTNEQGAAYVYFGSDTGLSAVPDWMTVGDQGYIYYGVCSRCG